MSQNDDLPIDVIPGSHPPKFRWRQYTDTPVGPRTVNCTGSLPVGVDSAVTQLIATARRLTRESVELLRMLAEAQADVVQAKAFKDWVHAYLDAQGVPEQFPDGPHTKEGCRVGDRMDWLVKTLTHSSAEDALRVELGAATKTIAEMQKRYEALAERVASQSDQLSKVAERPAAVQPTSSRKSRG